MISNNQVIASDKSKEVIQLKKVINNSNTRGKIGVLTRVLSGGISFSRDERKWLASNYKNESQESRASLKLLLNKTTKAWPAQEALNLFIR